MVAFIRTWLTVVVVFFILSLSWAIFSPILNGVFGSLVDQALYDNQQLSMHSDSGRDASAYYHQLYSAKTLILGFFNLFPFALSCILLAWAILSSLRKEESDYYI